MHSALTALVVVAALGTVGATIVFVAGGIAAFIVWRRHRSPRRVIRISVVSLAVAVVAFAAVATLGPRIDSIDSPGWTISLDPALSIAPAGPVQSGRLLPLNSNQPLSETAYALFSSGSQRRAVVPAFTTAAGTIVTVAPLTVSDAPVAMEVQLLVGAGTHWRSSNTVAVTVEAQPAVAHPGAPTLFLLDVGRALIAESDRRAAVAAAVLPQEAAEYRSTLNDVRAYLDPVSGWLAYVVEHGYTQFSVNGHVVTASDLAMVDRMAAGHLLAVGPASPSPCGIAKDADVAAVLGTGPLAASDVTRHASAFAAALLDCPAPEMADVLARIGATLAPAVRELDRVRLVSAAVLAQTFALGYGSGYANAAQWEATLAWQTDRPVPATLRSRPFDDYDLSVPSQLRTAAEALIGRQADALRADGVSYPLAVASHERAIALFDRARKIAQPQATQLAKMLRCGDRADCDPSAVQRLPATLPALTHAPFTPGPANAGVAGAATPGTSGVGVAPGGVTPRPTLVAITPRPGGGGLGFVPVQPPDATEGQPYPRFTFCDPEPSNFALGACGPGTVNPIGGQGPYHFQLDSGVGFPPIGMSLGKDGQLVGTPAAGSGGRTYTFRVCAVDLSGSQMCGDVALTVQEAPVATAASVTITRRVVNRYQGGSFNWYVEGIATGPPDAWLAVFTGSRNWHCFDWYDGPGICIRYPGMPDTTRFSFESSVGSKETGPPANPVVQIRTGCATSTCTDGETKASAPVIQ